MLLNDELWFVKQSFTVPLCCSCNVRSGQPGWDGSSGCGYLLPAVDALPKIVLIFLHVIFFASIFLIMELFWAFKFQLRMCK